MKASELRIGNFVHDNVEVKTITARDILFLSDEKYEHLASAIPLTEDWIVKFDLTLIKYVFEIYKNGNGEYFLSLEGNIILIIEHVHQFQNLHFALTGEELKYE